MSYLQFPKNRYFLILTASDLKFAIGKIDLATSMDLYQIQSHFIKEGAHAANTKFRMHICSNENCETPIVSSSWVDASELSSLTSSHWTGYITFTFSRTPLLAANDYWVAIEITGYTNPGDESYYWGIALDWPEKFNASTSDTMRGAAMAIAGYFT